MEAAGMGVPCRESKSHSRFQRIKSGSAVDCAARDHSALYFGANQFAQYYATGPREGLPA